MQKVSGYASAYIYRAHKGKKKRFVLKGARAREKKKNNREARWLRQRKTFFPFWARSLPLFLFSTFFQLLFLRRVDVQYIYTYVSSL